MKRHVTIIHCDRCGESMEGETFAIGTVPKTNIEILRTKWESADLCDKCKKEFIEWWYGKVKENGKINN